MAVTRNPAKAQQTSYAEWCKQLELGVEAEYSRMQAAGEALKAAAAPAVIATVDPKPKPAADPWATATLAPRARAELRAWLRKLDDFEVNLFWGLSKAIESHTGCDTPAEDFIYSVGMRYLRSLKPGNCGLTPDEVADELLTFRDNFRDALAVARHFNAQYPAEVKAL